ncbi:hypothetical protein H5410_060687 [Solanum commersonii]|uniref:DNA helicase Pif1-like 2B domain-containing protein n=1 Tax=Solanum commersonii TaxID=4109 RepID=A0A9J5W653_SOLCO|nr:hypothetical protein H5410_060687 [Solanum commersonii]
MVSFKFIKDFLQCTEESTYWIAVKIVCLELGHKWSYLTCKKYRLQIHVTDETRFISLLLWNKEVLQLIGKTAKELKEGLIGDADNGYPTELDTLIEKKLMFKVQIKDSNINKNDNVYKVVKFIDDEALLKEYCHPSLIHSLTEASLDCEQSIDEDKLIETPIKNSISDCVSSQTKDVIDLTEKLYPNNGKHVGVQPTHADDEGLNVKLPSNKLRKNIKLSIPVLRIRSESNNQMHAQIVNDLKEMLDQHNVLTKSFRMVRDRFQIDQSADVKLRLIGKRETDGRRYNLPTVSEVAALVVGDFEPTCSDRDIIIESHSGQLKRISELNAAYLGLQYPLLFPFGEDGYREDIPLNEIYESSDGRKYVSSLEYFSYKIQERKNEVPTIVSAKRLFQQFLRELPHAHILLFLHNKSPNIGDIDDIISAELPNKLLDPDYYESKFLSWFEANKEFPEARDLTYAEFPLKFVWKQQSKRWDKRKTSAFSIGRIFFVPPGSGEQYYLRLSLYIRCRFEELLLAKDRNIGNSFDGIDKVLIPKDLLITEYTDPIAAIVKSTYPDFSTNCNDVGYLQQRAILSLDMVESINQYMISLNHNPEKSYLSSDKICKSDHTYSALEHVHTPDFLNTIKCSGVPNHSIILKVRVPVMLLRNIDQIAGLCNGTSGISFEF